MVSQPISSNIVSVDLPIRRTCTLSFRRFSRRYFKPVLPLLQERQWHGSVLVWHGKMGTQSVQSALLSLGQCQSKEIFTGKFLKHHVVQIAQETYWDVSSLLLIPGVLRNMKFLYDDIFAGITVAIVLIPVSRKNIFFHVSPYWNILLALIEAKHVLSPVSGTS